MSNQTQEWECIFRDQPPGGEKIRIYLSPDKADIEIQGNRDRIWSIEGWSAWIVQIRNIHDAEPTIKAKPGHLRGVHKAIIGRISNEREDLIARAITEYCRGKLKLHEKHENNL